MWKILKRVHIYLEGKKNETVDLYPTEINNRKW